MGGVRAGTAMYSRHARIGSSRPKFPVPVPGQEALRILKTEEQYDYGRRSIG